jgi:hypothetical protein
MHKKYWHNKHILIFIVLLYLLLLGNIKFTAWPEMLLWPYLIIKGWLPYQDIAIAHNPLLITLLTYFYQIVGVGIIQLKIFTWSIISLIVYTIYFVAYRLYNKKTAFLSVIFSLPLLIYYQANGLWFDLLLSIFGLFVYYFFYKEKYFWTGLVWGIAFLTKQTAVFLLLPLILIKNNREKIVKHYGRMVTGTSTLAVLFLTSKVLTGEFWHYLYWTVGFAGGKLPFSVGQINFPSIAKLLMGLSPFILATIFVLSNKKRRGLTLLTWAFCAALGSYPRWELFHFLPAVPFLSILFARIYNIRTKSWSFNTLRKLSIAFIILLSIKSVYRDLNGQTRFFEQEVQNTAEYIKEKTKADEKIFVANAWDSFYVYTNTLPANKPWVPQLSWYMSLPGVEDKMLSDLLTSSPKYVIIHPYSNSGLDSFKPQKIADYLDKYYYQVQDFGNFIILQKR